MKNGLFILLFITGCSISHKTDKSSTTEENSNTDLIESTKCDSIADQADHFCCLFQNYLNTPRRMDRYPNLDSTFSWKSIEITLESLISRMNDFSKQGHKKSKELLRSYFSEFEYDKFNGSVFEMRFTQLLSAQFCRSLDAFNLKIIHRALALNHCRTKRTYDIPNDLLGLLIYRQCLYPLFYSNPITKELIPQHLEYYYQFTYSREYPDLPYDDCLAEQYILEKLIHVIDSTGAINILLADSLNNKN